MSFTARLTRPEKNNKYYASSTYNPFVASGYGMFQINGNCTAYSWGRWYEILKKKPVGLPTNNAENWYHDVKNFKKGNTPKLGAIICYRKGIRGVSKDGAGHVAIVEKINSDGSILVSESGAHNFIFRTSILKKPYKKTGYELEGFIYLPQDNNSNKDSSFTTFIKGVQKSLGLKETGISNKDLLTKTITISTKVNNKHKIVKVLQTYLKSLGYNLGTYGTDGIYGSDTKKAIMKYQKDIGLSNKYIDGIITKGMYTWRSLLKLN